MSTIYYNNNVNNFQKSFEWRFWNKMAFKIKLPSIKSYISRKLSRLFKRLYVHFEDVSRDINSYSSEESEKLYQDLQKLIPQLIKQQEKLVEVDFLDDVTLKMNLRKALDYSYIVEANAKKIANSKRTKQNTTDNELKQALSYLSKKNLTSKLN